jgi:hypothetical protein
VTDTQCSHSNSAPPVGASSRFAEPIPPCPAWFAEFMEGFRATTVAEALAIEAEETGVAAKRGPDPADTIRRLSRERPDILKRATRLSAKLWENMVAGPVEPPRSPGDSSSRHRTPSGWIRRCGSMLLHNLHSPMAA